MMDRRDVILQSVSLQEGEDKRERGREQSYCASE